MSLGAEPDPAELARAPGGPRFIEYAGRLSLSEVAAEVRRIREAGARVLFHPSYINFCGSFANSPEWLRETHAHLEAVGSPWFAQDCAYCFWGSKYGYSTQLGYFVPPVLSAASLARAVERVREVRAAVPVPVAVEPPPMCFAVGTMHLLDFFGELAERADCALLLDVGHLLSYQLASGRDVLERLPALPCERVIEVHIAGGRIAPTSDGDVYVDAHERDILEPCWDLLERLLPRLPTLKAVCFECEGKSAAQVLGTLGRLRERVRACSASPALVAAAEAAP